MTIRKAEYSDLERMMVIYREAREIQLESGNLHQWREGYPSEEIVRADISRGVSYVVVDDEARFGAAGSLVGAFAFIPGVDPTYLDIYDGEWLDDERPYATIHRLGSLKAAHGVAAACFSWCWSQIDNLRIDTHSDNAIMRHCVEKFGFRYCGIIYLLNGDPRLAYQKIHSCG